jgi:O-antigen ligase
MPLVQTADGTVVSFTEGFEPERAEHVYFYDVPGYGIVQVSHQPNYHWFRYRGFILVAYQDAVWPLDLTFQLINVNEPVPAWGFEGRMTWGSSRGYIFSRTFPLLPKRFFIGSGSDSFILEFPQHEVIAKARYFNDPYIAVDKAHNLYLQTAVTTGVISALALIVLLGFYLFTTFFALIRNKPPVRLFILRLGILAAVSAFAVSSMSTDSTLSSMPVFWVIIGIGYAVNRSKEWDKKEI